MIKFLSKYKFFFASPHKAQTTVNHFSFTENYNICFQI